MRHPTPVRWAQSPAIQGCRFAVLTEVEVCMARDEQAWRGLPERLVTLLDKSHRLYVRVARLDERARRASALGNEASP
jgi:hypothetical protein